MKVTAKNSEVEMMGKSFDVLFEKQITPENPVFVVMTEPKYVF